MTDKLKVLKFGAPWCGPCRKVSAVVEELKEVYKDKVVFEEVNIDENADLVKKYLVNSVPTIVFTKNGEDLYRHAGMLQKSKFTELIDKYL